jgi:ribonuclease-3
MRAFEELEAELAYRFRDQRLLTQALTHSSHAHEQNTGADNEQLEFLGDAVLGFVTSRALFELFPSYHEGQLSKLRAHLVSARHLQSIAERLELGKYLRLGRGEEKSGGRRKHALLADVFEAVTGAIYIDGGLEAARKFVEHSLGEELRTANPVAAAAADPKTMLQEKLQANHQPTPQYTVVETLGPPHKRMFHVELKWNGGVTRGEGQTIKTAEAAAAQAALEQMQTEEG